MQERMDAGKEGCTVGEDGCREGGIIERMDVGHEKYLNIPDSAVDAGRFKLMNIHLEYLGTPDSKVDDG